MDPLTAHHERLAAPPETGDLDRLAGLWQECRSRFICTLRHPVDQGPWLVHALRGAIGAVLHDMPARRAGDPAPYACLLEPGPFLDARRRVPPALLVEAHADGQTVVIDLRLFGAARQWRDALHLAAITALNGGVRVSDGSTMRRPWHIERFAWSELSGLAGPWRVVPPGPDLRLLPESPLAYGSGDHEPDRPHLFVASAASRLAGYARWHGLNLDIDLDAFAAAAERLDIVSMGEQPTVRIAKTSRRHPGIALKHRGDMSPLLIRHPDALTRKVLTMGSAVGAGGRTSFGFGRYRVDRSMNAGATKTITIAESVSTSNKHSHR